MRYIAAVLSLGLIFCSRALAQTTISVTTATDLVNALTTVDTHTGTSYIINFTGSITLGAGNTLPAINTASTVTIDGKTFTLDGGSAQRGFFVYAGTVTIQNITIQNCLAQGGNGGNNAGGGLGAGGGLFVAASAAVTLNNVTFGTAGNPNQATGGNGGTGSGGVGTGGGGGGGLGGNGGDGFDYAGGGGGGVGLGADGSNADGPNGGDGIVIGAAAGGVGVGTPSGAGGNNGGGGAGGGDTFEGVELDGSSTTVGGGGGGGFYGSGGDGGFGGGGGGGDDDGIGGITGGTGGFGGGGGSGEDGAPGGAGGFGGGGGGGPTSGSAAAGGFGGGTGGTGTGGGGGGGLGAGGAIFVQQGATLNIDGPLTIGGNSVTGGSNGAGTGVGSTAGGNGAAYGTGIFISGSDSSNGGSGVLSFAPSAGQTVTVSDVIADQTGNGGSGGNAGSWGLNMNGAGGGILVLSGANKYSGNTTVQAGTLKVNGSIAAASAVSVASGATIGGTGTVNGNLTAQAGGLVAPGNSIGTLNVGGAFTWNGSSGAAMMQFELSNIDATSDKLAITGALTKGTAGTFKFDFQGEGHATTYTLMTFASTTFSLSDFAYANLGAGLTGTFALVGGTQLQFTVVAGGGGGGGGSVVPTPGTPFVLSVIPPANGTYVAGQTLDFEVTFDQDVAVVGSGPPEIPIMVGSATRYATYASGSGGAQLLFAYTVQSSDSAPAGIVVQSPVQGNGANIEGADGTLGAPSNFASLGFRTPNTSGILIGAATAAGSPAPPNPSSPSPSAAQTITFNQSAVFSNSAPFALQASASSGLPVSYALLSGPASLSGPTITLTDVPGIVTVQATQAGNASYLAATPVTVSFNVSSPAPLLDASVLAQIVPAQNQIVVGFVIAGSGTKPVLLRGVGPSLATYGVLGALAAPVLALYNSSGALLVSNSGWAGNSTLAALFAQVGAFPLASGGIDAATSANLSPGSYTLIVGGVSGAKGAALAEVYDASMNPLSQTLAITNISSFGQVAPAQPIVAGFVLGGLTAKQILIRAVGPGLGSLGLNPTLPDPLLSLYDAHGTLIAQNENWGTPVTSNTTYPAAGPAAIAAAASAAGAFALPANSMDSAILITLPPGSYSARLSSAGTASGPALIEAYEIP